MNQKVQKVNESPQGKLGCKDEKNKRNRRQKRKCNKGGDTADRLKWEFWSLPIGKFYYLYKCKRQGKKENKYLYSISESKTFLVSTMNYYICKVYPSMTRTSNFWIFKVFYNNILWIRLIYFENSSSIKFDLFLRSCSPNTSDQLILSIAQ